MTWFHKGKILSAIKQKAVFPLHIQTQEWTPLTKQPKQSPYEEKKQHHYHKQ